MYIYYHRHEMRYFGLTVELLLDGSGTASRHVSCNGTSREDPWWRTATLWWQRISKVHFDTANDTNSDRIDSKSACTVGTRKGESLSSLTRSHEQHFSSNSSPWLSAFFFHFIRFTVFFSPWSFWSSARWHNGAACSFSNHPFWTCRTVPHPSIVSSWT